MIKPGIIIGLDFDGTCVTHEFPNVGKDLPYCVETLKKIVAAGGKLILWTMRSNINHPVSDNPEIHCLSGEYLNDAIDWFKDRDIPLWGVQKNPQQYTWTTSPKAYAHIYIDDAALGSFTIQDPEFSNRPYIDWATVDAFLFPEEY